MSDQLSGIGVSPGLVAAPVMKLPPRPRPPAARPVTDPEAERASARTALTEVATELSRRAAAASGPATDVLRAQALMVADPMLLDAVDAQIRNGTDAPHAIEAAFATHRAAFLAAGGLLAERVTDLDDLRDRGIAAVLGVPPPGIPDPGRPFVLAAVDLSPADTSGLDPDTVLALVTAEGGPTSHTAILARAAGLPAVVGCRGITEVPDGTPVSVDGETGTVRVGLDDTEVASVRAHARARTAARSGVTGPGRTRDGHPVALLANVGSPTDLPSDGDYEGVGLFRTELCFLDRVTAPDHPTQVAAYRAVFAAVEGRPVTVRTLDAGADKPVPFANDDDEPNPALGIRGLRLDRRGHDLLDGQLAAIAEAAADTGAHVRVMAPMVATVHEAVAFADRARRAGLTDIGVMVEVPAAALHADRILAQVDFLSIGTNDLSQYTFAADRQCGELADLLDPRQPALLELIGRCGAAGAAAGKSVGVCGEAAADPGLAPILVGLGVTSLSMSARSLPAVRHTLVGVSLAECRERAERALAG